MRVVDAHLPNLFDKFKPSNDRHSHRKVLLSLGFYPQFKKYETPCEHDKQYHMKVLFSSCRFEWSLTRVLSTDL